MLAAGLAIAGVGGLDWMRLSEIVLRGAPGTADRLLALAYAALPVIGVAVCLVLAVRRAAAPSGSPAGRTGAAGAAWAMRGWSALGVLTLGSAAAVGWVDVWRMSAGDGPVHTGPVVFSAGATLAVLALAWLTWAPREWAPGAFRRRWESAVCGAAASGVALACVLGLTGVLAVDAATAQAADPGEPAAVPGSVSEVGWTWEPPGGQEVLGGQRAGPGVVVHIGDGAVALDTATGEQRWHYRRPGSVAVGVFAAPEVSRVVVVFSPDTGRRPVELPPLVVVLDAHTGAVRAQFPDTGTGFAEVEPTALVSEHAFVVESLLAAGGGALAGFGLTTGERVWTAGGCDGVERAMALEDGVVVQVVRCRTQGEWDGAEREVLAVEGINSRRGSRLWRYEVPAMGPASAVVYRSADGDAVGLRGVTGGRAVESLEFDARGRVVARAELEAVEGPGGGLVEVSPGAEGLLGGWDGEDRTVVGWEASGSGRARVVVPPQGADVEQASGAALEDAVVVGFAPVGAGGEAAAVVSAPWDGTEAARVEVAIGDAQEVSLVAAPGAVVVVGAGGGAVAGLV
ncbi:hypothetical protein ACFO4E_14100 [Nocardiopsis mangrovi]|uniref:Uncharacterized protein n=1 Tax=Nocardiopsis mangrovi TaxID=1179818 RepID=A0ABV9DX36_9ACTN